jgi:hypothetical protein
LPRSNYSDASIASEFFTGDSEAIDLSPRFELAKYSNLHESRVDVGFSCVFGFPIGGVRDCLRRQNSLSGET